MIQLQEEDDGFSFLHLLLLDSVQVGNVDRPFLVLLLSTESLDPLSSSPMPKRFLKSINTHAVSDWSHRCYIQLNYIKEKTRACTYTMLHYVSGNHSRREVNRYGPLA